MLREIIEIMDSSDEEDASGSESIQRESFEHILEDLEPQILRFSASSVASVVGLHDYSNPCDEFLNVRIYSWTRSRD